MKPQKWKLISSKDVSPSKWFPIEERTYLLPNGQTVYEDDLILNNQIICAQTIAAWELAKRKFPELFS